MYPRRDVVDAIRYLDRTGCQWDALPADFPHPKLVYHYFKTWTDDGTLNRMHNSLREQVRTVVQGRTRQPTAAVVDSQTVNVQDRDAARPLLWALRACFPTISLVWADSGYAGKLVQWAANYLALSVQIVAKLAGQTTFVVLPRRWCVERTFSWINRCRRTVRDYERLPEHHAAMVQWAMIIVMARRLASRQAT